MSRKSKVESILIDYTKNIIKTNSLDGNGMDALYVAQEAKIDRSNASQELNSLWREGKAIKIIGHPVLYLSKTLIDSLYSNANVPNTILKDEKLNDFLRDKNSLIPQRQYDIDSIIGASGSLSIAIEDAKAAISYPPYGLPILLIGNPGLSKLGIARSLNLYAKEIGRKPENADFIRIECQSYSSPEKTQDFLIALNGLKNEQTLKGAIGKSNKGTVYLNNIHRLSTDALSTLLDMIERQSYTKIGDSNIKPLNCTIIASIPQTENETIAYLKKYFAATIDIPDIEERSVYEKIEQIFELFQNEAVYIQKNIKISKDILFIFAKKHYKDNIPEMRAEVKQACSRSYMHTNKDSNTVTINFQNLSVDLLSSLNTLDQTSSAIQNILAMIESDHIVFESNGKCEVRSSLQNKFAQSNSIRLDQFMNKLDSDVAVMNNTDDFITENISCISNCGNAQLNKIKSTINPLVQQIFLESIRDSFYYQLYQNNPRLLYGMLLHVSNLLNRLMNNNEPTHTGNLGSTSQLFPETHALATKISDSLMDTFKVTIPSYEIDFISMYLSVAAQWNKSECVPLLLICRGDSIATQLKHIVMKMHDDSLIIDAIDYREDIQLNDLLELITIRCNSLDKGFGIIIMTDIEPVKSISEYLLSTLKIRTRTISPFTLVDLFNIADQISSKKSMDQIVYDHYANNNIQKSQVKSTEINDTSFIYRLTTEFITPTLSFLDARKAVDAMMISLSNILLDLNISYSNEIATKFLCHSVNMLERVIRNDYLSYPKCDSFINNNKTLYHTIESNLHNINELYGIVIPKEEIAYITEIFLY